MIDIVKHKKCAKQDLTPVFAISLPQWATRFLMAGLLLINGVTAIQAAEDIDQYDDRGYTKLMYAVQKGETKQVKQLLKAGAKASLLIQRPAGSNLGRQTILEMIPEDKLDTLGDILLQHGADVNAIRLDEETILATSINEDNVKFFTWLLEHGANPNKKGKNGNTALFSMVMNGGVEDEVFLTALIKHGADPALVNEEGESTLTLLHGNVRSLLMLEKSGANVDIDPKALLQFSLDPHTEFTPSEKEQILIRALDAGANPNLVLDTDNISVLALVLMGKPNNNIIEALISHGVDVDFVGSAKFEPYISPLILAIRNGTSYEMIKKIVKRSKNINKRIVISRMKVGAYTALDFAVLMKRENVVQLLKKAGAVSAKLKLPEKTFATNKEAAKQQVQKFIDSMPEEKCSKTIGLASWPLWFDRMYLSKEQWLTDCSKLLKDFAGAVTTEAFYPKDSKDLMNIMTRGEIKPVDLEYIILVDTLRPKAYFNFSFILSCTNSKCKIIGINDHSMRDK
jgi:ankyrin repeat protein